MHAATARPIHPHACLGDGLPADLRSDKPPHLDSERLLRHYVAIPVTIPEQLIRRVRMFDLPRNWNAYPASRATRSIGDEWVTRESSAVLQVPSGVIPSEANFLLNPAHQHFHKL
jgi:RES domain-containing protein